MVNDNYLNVINDKAHDENLYTDEMKREYKEEIASIIRKLDITEKDNDMTKIKKINDYIKDNISIRDNYFHALDGDVDFDRREMLYRTGYAALIKGEAMCAGFTEATRSLLESVNIKTHTLITKLPGKNKQLLHYVCVCETSEGNKIIDPERQGSCERKGFDFDRYLDGMIFIVPEENFCRNKVGKTGVGPKALDYLKQPFSIYKEGLGGVDELVEIINEKENTYVQRH